MKKHIIHIAGLTLAATLFAPPIFAQQPPSALPHPPTTPPPAHHLSRVEVEARDEDDAFATARAGIGNAETTVRRIFAGGESTDHPLIVSSGQPDEKLLATLDEDLNIMARVLDKSIDHGDDADRKGPFGIHMWALGGGRSARNLYIDGYGAIFTVNVNIPLLAPPSKPQAEEKKEETSSTWDEARNELYGHDEDRRGFKRIPRDKKPAQPFDAERVDALKNDLIESLKNATHIRGLKNDDHVTIVVQGPGSNGGVGRAFTVGSKGEIQREDVFGYAFAGGGSGGRSVMTLRAKKSDIDAFAKGKTDFDDFRKKVSVSVYQTPGGASGSGQTMRLEQ